MNRIIKYFVFIIITFLLFGGCSEDSINDISNADEIEIIPLKNNSNWIWQNPKPQGNNLNDIEIINEKEIIAVGDLGTIIKSNDEGMTWYKLNIGFSSPIYSVEFINSSIGLITTFEGVFKTSDGGLSWERINNDDIYDNAIREIQFLDDNIGFGRINTLSSGILKRTNDGGVTWDTILERPNGATFLDLYFYNSNIGWVATLSSGIYYTIDGGSNWQNIQTSSRIESIFFFNDKIGLGINSENIYKTINSGQSWDILLHKDYAGFKGIEFSGNSFGWINSLNGIFITNDSGSNWKEYKIGDFGSGNHIRSIDFINETIAFAAGTYGILNKSFNSGINWESIKREITDTYTNFSDILFRDESNGIIIGDNSIILQTSDGGSNWANVIVPISNNLNKLSFINSDIGFACGDNGTLLKTSDFGINWVELNSNTNKNITSCFALSENKIWIVGNNGLIQNSIDGGETWNNIELNSNYDNKDIFFYNDSIGIIINDFKFFKTKDGGKSWQEIQFYSGDINHVRNVYMKNESTCFLTTEYGLLKSTDGAESWSIVFDGDINKIGFSNDLVGWCCGRTTSNNAVYLTINGGSDWVESPITSWYLELNSAYFIDKKTGWVVGDRGTIVKSNFEQ